jgi:hypothetical protein
MPATTEMLTEQITMLREKIAVKRREGSDVSELEHQANELSKRLASASAALNESRQILKG